MLLLLTYLLLLYSFSVLQFLVVVSVRQIKPTYVGFRAHVKIASRIVSYRTTRTWCSNTVLPYILQRVLPLLLLLQMALNCECREDVPVVNY